MTQAPHLLFDRRLILQRARRALARGWQDDVLLPRIAEEMAERVGVVLRSFTRAVDLATPGPQLARAVGALPNVTHLLRADPLGAPAGLPVVAALPEALPFAPESLDLVVSALALQAVDDLPGTLVQIRRALKPDGLFIAAMLGGDTLGELREAFAQAEGETTGGVSPRVAPFAAASDLGALLQRAGFALPVVDSDRITVRYRDLWDLFTDLRHLGATNPLNDRTRTPLRRATLARMAEIYRERFADPDGKLRVSVEIIWLSGWAPDESQQKPLRPGSAKMRLADALKVREMKGE